MHDIFAGFLTDIKAKGLALLKVIRKGNELLLILKN